MLKHVCFVVGVVAVIGALAARPAKAADDIASKAQACAACHGENGVPTSAVTPVIWGQQSYYLYKDLHDYHSGALDNPVMSPLAKGFTLAQLRRFADYFAAKTCSCGSPAKGGMMSRAKRRICSRDPPKLMMMYSTPPFCNFSSLRIISSGEPKRALSPLSCRASFSSSRM